MNLQDHYSLMVDNAVHSCSLQLHRDGGGYLNKIGRKVWPGTLAYERLIRAERTLLELSERCRAMRADGFVPVENHQNDFIIQAAE